MSDDLLKTLRDVAAAYPEDMFPPFSESERKEHSVIISRASGCMGRFLSKHMTEAAAEIERLRAEVARLVKSRNKWGQKYNRTLEKLKLAVWTDTEEVKAVNEAANAAVVARDEAVREVSRLGRELGTTQARLAEAVEWIREARKFCQDGLAGDGCTPQQALERIHEASGDILAKLEGRSDAIRAMEEKP